MPDTREDVDKLIEAGAPIAGSVTGAAVGFFVGGLAGAAAGAVVGSGAEQVFRRVGSEISRRLLGKREEVRIGATFSFAAKKIKENIASGKRLREDDFFGELSNERPAAYEILEGVLLSAQREHQEKKVQFYGNLLGNLPFRSDVDRTQANQLIKLAQGLSYRQLGLLEIFAASDYYNLRAGDYRSDLPIGPKLASLLQEVYELYNQGTVNCSGTALLGLVDVNPKEMNLQSMGSLLFQLMELKDIDREDLREFASLFNDRSQMRVGNTYPAEGDDRTS